MKNYKKGLLTLMVLSAMSLMAAEDTFIHVTTFDDAQRCTERCYFYAVAETMPEKKWCDVTQVIHV